MEVGSGRQAAVLQAVEPLGADLSRQVDRERLGDRDHPLVPGDLHRVADVLDRVHGEAVVGLEHVVEPPGAHRPAADHGPGDHALVDELGDGLGDHLGVHGQVTPVLEVLKHLVGHPAQPDLQGRPVVHEARDVARDLLADAPRLLVQVLGHGRVHQDGVVDPLGGDEAVATRAWHRRVDLGDDRRRRQHRGPGDVHRDAEAAHAVVVRRGHLHQRHVERLVPVGEHGGDVGQRHRDVVDQPRRHQVPDVAADVVDAMAVRRPGPARRRRSGPRGRSACARG